MFRFCAKFNGETVLIACLKLKDQQCRFPLALVPLEPKPFAQFCHGLRLMFLGQVGVAVRHGDGLMAEKFLHRDRIHARHDEMRGKGMSQVMEPEILILAALQAFLKAS